MMEVAMVIIGKQSSSQIITLNITATGWTPFLSPNQQCQSTEGITSLESSNLVSGTFVDFDIFLTN